MSTARRLLSRMREDLRQRRHHRSFRIPPPDWDEELVEHVERLLATIVPPEEPPPPLDEKALAAAATSLWRAERRLTKQDDDSPAKSRQAGRFVRTTRTALAEAGLVVQDHDGEQFHPGRALEVLLFQEDPSLDTETVLETVQPSIYLNDRHIQMGQVIVGCPPQPSSGPDDHVRNDHE
ncbi:hypothetical protein E1286_06310 [Nonomuraea terrae]|uniref:Nucleotide exchange factor GrpE n=1 Tax=Nonomuraea terrae TaxID=2530383 RepID=A0A4R4Z8U0_9ACTN|nr:hypothetical protein [Nonomuraea terrae]TDD54110.1 hypothetical protein E1286_06310 [Nonomuraea terrae]